MKKLSIIFISLFLVGCYASMIGGLRGDFSESKIQEKNDDFEKASWVNVTLSSPSFSEMTEKAIRFQKIIKPKDESLYLMYTYFYKSGWLFADKIKIKINDKMYVFESIKNTRNVLNGGYIEERCAFPVSRKFIQEMAIADSVTIRLYGKDAYMGIDYDKEKHQILLKEFLQRTE